MPLSKLLDFLRQRKIEITVLFLTVYGLYIRFKTFHLGKLSRDEMNQLLYTQGPLKPFWGRLVNTELTSFPGDYLLTYPFVQIDPTNKWIIMIPHFIAVFAGFYFFYFIIKNRLTSTVSFFIAFLMFALNGNLLSHAFELRPYPVLITLALICFCLTEYLVRKYEDMGFCGKFFITLFFIITTIFHAYGIFMIFFCFLYHLSARQTRGGLLKNVSVLFKYGLLLAFVTCPVFLWYATRHPEVNALTFAKMNIHTFDFIPNPLQDPVQFLKSVFGNLLGYRPFWLLMPGPFLALMIPNKHKMKQLGLFLTLVIVPILIILLADLHKGYWFVQRQFVWLTPFFILYISWCWDSVILFIQRIFSKRSRSFSLERQPEL